MLQCRSGRPGLPGPESPHGLCGRKATSEEGEVCLAMLCCMRFIFKRLCYARNNAYFAFTFCCGRDYPHSVAAYKHDCMETTQDNFDLMSALTRSLHSVRFLFKVGV